ncbi:hypothetical protein RG47T_4053 [Mucilaginibacter polytrichastri]|uniref:DUF922 domain-containing protein n=2 Tax=Mucilaginibacter polytrichastri TaxID=1302689 RepID=A0A1Q6A3K4_9SPHI|nr:hypothetical protein RG47T_4053 [Mucilaginibacter polytrichastri]
MAFIFTSVYTVKAQSYHQLNAADFEGTPERGSGNIAYTNCMVDFSYKPMVYKGNYNLTFFISMKMNKDRSWIDRMRVNSPEMLAEVLKHEQGHYIFAYLMQQEMQSVFNNMHFGSNYEQQVNTVFNAIKKKYSQLNTDYDEDTSHMQNRAQQNSWNLYFKSQLSQYNNIKMASNGR